jgi:hypothetical protein
VADAALTALSLAMEWSQPLWDLLFCRNAAERIARRERRFDRRALRELERL